MILVEKEKLGKEDKFTFLSLDRKLANETDSIWLFEIDTTLRIFKNEFFDIDGNTKIFYQTTIVNETNKKALHTFMANKLKK